MVKFIRYVLNYISRQYCSGNHASIKSLTGGVCSDPKLIRNIGILAHIDAGKTTTTERMLFYSGTINLMGEVHHGNTVTDFMDQERQRGITITSASVTFPWGNHSVNLVDTPGHIDFTMEVEQTLQVLDGAIIVLDASAGVEAQTLTVWRQANKYAIPRMIYINKMDRPHANFKTSILSIEKSLSKHPLPLQIPLMIGKTFKGVIDLINLEVLEWDRRSLGVVVARRHLNKADGNQWENAVNERVKLTEALADLDDRLADYIINSNDSLEDVPAQMLRDSICKTTEELKGVPVLCGSSYKNIGVQPLLDAVVQYLPSPLVRKPAISEAFGDNLCARVFKVRHDSHKGPISFLRIYSGRLKKGQKIFNIRPERTEQTGKLFVVTANDYDEVEEKGLGSIVAIAGLKSTITGDIVTSTSSAASAAKKKLKDNLTIFGANIPDPVFFCSIECSSQAHQAALDRALLELSREDPSLRVSQNLETGQTVLGGMGELHLDVIKERICKEYNVEVDLGSLQIAYKEALVAAAKDSHKVNLRIGSSTHSVNITLSVTPCEDRSGDVLHFDRSQDSAANIAAIHPRHINAIKAGVESALSRGPRLFCPVVNTKVTLHFLEVGRGTSDTVVTSASSQCIRKLLETGGTKILEPIMALEIVCSPEYISFVTADLNRRRAVLGQFSARGTDQVLQATAPLSELLGYASQLRTITSGHASFSMELESLQDMTKNDEAKAIKAVTGLDPL